MGSRRGAVALSFNDGSQLGLKPIGGVAKDTQTFLVLLQQYISGHHISPF